VPVVLCAASLAKRTFRTTKRQHQFIAIHRFWEFIAYLENRRQPRRNLNKKNYTTKLKIDCRFPSTTFQGFEIGNMAESNYDLVDLHKNVVDEITLVSASGKPMKREADLIDVWFDSGSMPMHNGIIL
jgi:hypothetical protein